MDIKGHFVQKHLCREREIINESEWKKSIEENENRKM